MTQVNKLTQQVVIHFCIPSKFQIQTKIINFWGPYIVHFKHRDSPYVVHFKRRDCPYVVHFICRDCPYVQTLPFLFPLIIDCFRGAPLEFPPKKSLDSFCSTLLSIYRIPKGLRYLITAFVLMWKTLEYAQTQQQNTYSQFIRHSQVAQQLLHLSLE